MRSILGPRNTAPSSASSRPETDPGKAGTGSRPLSFLEAAAFQWVNPKGWVAAIAITAQFVTPEALVRTAFLVAAAFVLSGLSSTLAWVSFGRIISRWLDTPSRLRAFNLTMALLLVGFLALILMEQR